MAAQQSPSADVDFLQGGGEAGALMRARDWTATPLGAPSTWPQSLRTAVRILLDSRYAMWMAWGEGMPFLYNDAYAPTLGSKHPQAMGQPTREVWAEVWDFIGSRLPTVMAGEATWDEGLLLFLERSGFREETYHSFSYSPLRDEAGAIRGVFCVVTEETERNVAVRHTQVLRELAVRVNDARTVDGAAQAAVRVLADAPLDVPYLAMYRLDADAGIATRMALGGLADDTALLPPTLPLDSASGWPLGPCMRERAPVVVEDLQARVGPQPVGPWGQAPTRAVVLPIDSGESDAPGAAIVAALSPHRTFDAAYRGFLQLAAAQIGGAMGIAHGYELAQRRAEQLAELDRAKTAFFSNVSHEFRTPLTLMLGPLQDLGEQDSVPPDIAGTLHVVHRNALRLQRLVNTLLEFSRVEAGRTQAHPQPTDLSAMTADLASTFRSACERAGLRLDVDCPPLPGPVAVDPGMWETIVLNLLSNAFKHTFEGGITVRIRGDAQHAELEVADTGTGIPAADVPQLFDRFHRVAGARGRSHEGSGIGLALVQELVRLHDGRIDVDSTPGRGTTFRITLPAGHWVPDAAAPTARVGQAQAYVAEVLRWLPDPVDEAEADAVLDDDDRPRIVVADDNADLRAYLSHLLRRDYRVDAVADGQAALDIVRAAPPALVLTDVMMPGLDGFGLLQALRAQESTRSVPVILLSARAGEEARIDGLQAGADDYIVKPFSARELLARVAAVIATTAVRRDALVREDALQRERLEVLETIGDAFIALDADWVVRYVNPALERAVRQRSEALVGRTHWEAFPANAGLEPVLRGAMADRQARRLDHFYAPVGRWFNVDVVPAPDGGLHIYGRDITEQRLASDALRVSEQRFREMANTAPAMLWITDPDGQCTFLSQAWSDFTGQAELDGLGLGWIDAVHPDHRQQAGEAFLQANAAREPFTLEHLLRTADGQYRWVIDAGRPRFDADGGFAGYIGSVMDVDDSRAVHVALLESQTRYRRLFEAMDEGFCVLDVLRAADGTPDDLRFVEANPSFEQQSGLKDVVGRTIREVVPGAWDWWVRTYAAVADTGQRIRFEQHAEALGRWFEVHAFRLDAEAHAGAGARVAVLFSDITPRKHDEQALHDADRRKDEFLATLAHELRNPLTPITNALQMFDAGIAEDPAQAQRLHAIMRRQARQLTRLVDDLMEVSRITRGRIELQREGIDLRTTVRDALDASAQAVRDGGHVLDIDLPATPLPVCADTVRLAQVFTNLLTNAARHSDAGGRIGVRGWRQDDTVRVSVSDTGHGVAPDQQARIFELFAQVAPAGSREGGLGIGLTLARRLVEMHGGTIELASPGEGQGSTFTVSLPLHHVSALVPAVAADVAAGALDGLRVVVADDNRDAASTLVMWLGVHGAHATQAHDGTQALQAIEDVRPHAVLLDLGMPRGGGIEVARRLRARADIAQPLLVAVTGWGQPVDRERTHEAGFDHHLTKPPDLDALHAVLAPLAVRVRG